MDSKYNRISNLVSLAYQLENKYNDNEKYGEGLRITLQALYDRISDIGQADPDSKKALSRVPIR